MRLSDIKAGTLKEEILKVLPNAKIYLFGSRVDNQKKGGDIDILIIDEAELKTIDKSRILMYFWKKYGEQKIDLVCFTPTSKSAFKQVALDKAIRL